MRLISATDVAIAQAIKAGTLTVVERPSRFGDTYFAIADEHGLIEVRLTRADVDARLAQIKAAI